MTTIDRDQPSSDAAALGLDIRPIAGHIGAEIHGVDLRDALAPAVVAEIRATLLRWKVVFFRDQDLTQEQHLAFGRQFADVMPGHPTLPPAFVDHPEILLLDNQAGGAGGGMAKGAPRIESRWHTDVTFIPNPPMGSILRGLVVPPYGGDTQWTNLAVAYSTLSPEVQAFIDPLHAVHHNVLPIERGDLSSELGSQFASRILRAVHPVVRIHPETGEKVLFVTPNFTSHIVELSRRESNHVLAMLYEHLMNPAYTCRFHWEPHSIAFWDNRATAHLVPTDVPSGMHRSMQRITLVGDLPVGPDGSTSYALD
jgi:alpha-ketoglutarate-dependent taurine dioxygenase